MKKLLSILLALSMTLCLASCGSKPDSSPNEEQGDNIVATPDATPDAMPTPDATPEAAESEALTILKAVWDSYKSSDKFSCMGGSTENIVMDAPGAFPLDAGLLDGTLGCPAGLVDELSGAASLVHMMNSNIFTCGAFTLKSADSAASAAKELEGAILARQWLCGFPDSLAIYTVDGSVLSVFGEAETVSTFCKNFTALYPHAVECYNGPAA